MKPEDKLSSYALLIAQSVELLEQLSDIYQNMGETLKNVSMMVDQPLDDVMDSAYAVAQVLAEQRTQVLDNLELVPECASIKEFLAIMKLHCMWVSK